MARNDKQRAMAAIPQTYSQDWLSALDGRTKVAKAVQCTIRTIEADRGGSDLLSTLQRALINHAVWCDALIRAEELRLAAGEPVDLASFGQLINTFAGLAAKIGLDRKAKPVQSISERMRNAS